MHDGVTLTPNNLSTFAGQARQSVDQQQPQLQPQSTAQAATSLLMAANYKSAALLLPQVAAVVVVAVAVVAVALWLWS